MSPAHLHDILRRHLERPGARVTVAELIRVARVQMLRPGVRSRREKEALVAWIEAAGAALHDPSNDHELAAFASRVTAFRRSSAARRGDIRRALAVEAKNAANQVDLVERATARVRRERMRRARGPAVPLERGDILRDVLRIDDERTLPRADVRQHLARARDKTLGDVLRESADFDVRKLREILGEELFGLCLPIGFQNARRTRLLVLVRSSAMAHEVSMRKRELLSRLRSSKTFAQVQDLRFTVRAPSKLPFVGAPLTPR